MSETTPAEQAAQRMRERLATYERHCAEGISHELALELASYHDPDDVRAVLGDRERLGVELEQLADLDAAASGRKELQADRDRAVMRWHDEHKARQAAEAERDRFAAELAALRTE